jgi:hypothetical protein
MKQETTNDTPETNKFRASLDGMREINQRDRLLSHARKLERERDDARAMARDMRNQLENGSPARLLFPWENANVDLPDTAAQDSASKPNNPAVSG